MNRAILIGLGLIVWLGSCTQRMVCPAYQSAFIYDKEALRKKFSYFQDTVPKVFTASKNKFLVAEAVPYRKKARSLQTVVAKPVMVEVPDSISGKAEGDSVITAELDRAARSVIDSTVIVETPATDTASVAAAEDSVYVITKGKEVQLLKYNTPDTVQFDSVNGVYIYPKPKYYVKDVRFGEEQDTYMWYLRHSLVLPDVRLAKMQGDQKGETSDSKAKKKKGGFFKNLFRKKSKDTEIDSAEIEIDPEQENRFDFIDTTAHEDSETIEQQTPVRKKGLLSRDKDVDQEGVNGPINPADNKKRSKKKKKKETEATKPKEKTEDESDGF